MKKKRIFVGIFLSLYLFFVMNPFGIRYTKWIFFNSTDSLPIGIYISIPNFGLRNGDMVAFYADDEVYDFAFSHKYIEEGQELPCLLKYVETAGHTYDITDHGFFIDNTYIGDIARYDSAGNLLPQQPLGHHVVQPGEIISYTMNSRSFDSRYFGPVKTSRIETRIIPLLTFSF